MTAPVDVLVAGGGPVGLAAALEARARGLSVTVVEPRVAPVDKACGEGLMPGTVRSLTRLGVDVEGFPIEGIRYVGIGGATTAEHGFAEGPGRGVRRTQLHAGLAARAAASGVEVVAGKVHDVVQDGARVRALVATERRDRELEGAWLLACDGLHSPIRRRLGLDGGSDGRRYGQRRHVRLAPWTRLVEVHWSPVAEAYVTPVAADEVGVAVLGPPGLRFEEALRSFPALVDRLGAARWTTPVRGAGPLRQRATGRVSGRVLLVGDAAGYVDALTGEGLRVGLASASAAADAVARRDVAGYDRAWASVTRDYRWITAALVGATRVDAVRHALVPAAARLPGVFGRLVDALAA